MSNTRRDSSQAHVDLSGITKRYGGVTALDNIDFSCELGSVHAVLGKNGVGKSTLINVMSGVVQPDEGEMRLKGKPVSFLHPAAANVQGIVCIFQELSLMPDLSVADNISIADPPRKFGLIDRKAQRLRAEDLLAHIGCEDVNPMSRVRDLPLSRRQMVESAKALARDPGVLILDEATSALTAADVDTVFGILRRLRDDGVSILTISQRVYEIEAIADRCSVLRNGRHIETFQQGARSEGDIVQMMIGREITAHFPPKPPPPPKAATPMLHLRDDGWENRLKAISLSVGAGEIVGLGGLDGQGQKELLLGLFGVLRGTTGTVTFQGKEVEIRSPRDAKRTGVDRALIPEDRKTEGLMLPMSIAHNLTIASLSRLSRGSFVDATAQSAAVEDGIQRMQIKVGTTSDPVSTLSGGNQQKVVIAKWLMTDPKIVLGGTSLLGGVGTAIGSIFGALILRTISFNFRIFEIDPLMQPLFEGVVLLAAVSLGAFRVLRVFRVKNTLELFR